MKTLLASGAEVNSESGYLLSPFFSACCMGHYRTAEVLYRAGADFHIPNGLFRNIWDPDELRQSVNNFEACLVKNFGRKFDRVWDLPSVFDEAAVQFKHMEQTINAEEMYRRALAGRTRELGAEHPHTLASINNLASILQDQGNYEEAEEMNRQVLEGRKAALVRASGDVDQRRYSGIATPVSRGRRRRLAIT